MLQHKNDAQFRRDNEKELEPYNVAATFTERTGIGTVPTPWFRLFLKWCPRPWEQSGGN